jgi:hypothetical protein
MRACWIAERQAGQGRARDGTRWRAVPEWQDSRQDRDEPRAGTLLSGQAGLGLVK